jgi:hypothetical protein
VVLIFEFCILGLLAYRSYTSDPPIPGRVVDPAGQTLFTGDDIRAGQKIRSALDCTGRFVLSLTAAEVHPALSLIPRNAPPTPEAFRKGVLAPGAGDRLTPQTTAT